MIRSYVLAAAAAVSVFTTVSPLAAEGLPTQTRKLLPAALAVEVATTAIATCRTFRCSQAPALMAVATSSARHWPRDWRLGMHCHAGRL